MGDRGCVSAASSEVKLLDGRKANCLRKRPPSMLSLITNESEDF